MTGTAPPNPGKYRATPYVGHLPGNRAMNLVEIEELQRARAAGATARQLADRFGVSVRTIYRWLDTEVVQVEVGGWAASFAIRPKGDQRPSPVQIDEWTR